MALSVVSRTGKDFWRCGIKFGTEAVIVGREKLDEHFASPPGKRKKPVTVEQTLKEDPNLVCAEVPEPKKDKPGKDEK